MSYPGQRLALLAIGIAAAGGIAFLTWNLGADSGPGVAGLEGKAAPVERTVARPLPSASSDDLPRILAGGVSGTSLRVVVVDPKGKPSADAEIVLTAADGSEVTATGGASWDDFPPGDWELFVNVPRFVRVTRAISVVEGQSNLELVRLTRNIEIRGRVLDVFGEPVAAMPLWFLRGDESHPATDSRVSKLLGGLTDHEGKFLVELPKRDLYRVSVGRIGEQLASMTQARELFAGGSQEVDVVVAGMTRVEAQIEFTGSHGERDRKIALVVLQQRAEDGASDPAEKGRRRSSLVTRPGPKSGKKKDPELPDANPRPRASDSPKDRAKGRDDPAGEDPADPDPARDPPPPGDGPAGDPGGAPAGRDAQWKVLTRVVPDADGHADLGRLPAGRNLLLVLERRRDRLETPDPFVLVPDRRTLLRISPPGPRTDEEIEARPTAPLFVSVDQRGRDPDDLRPGFYWK